MGFLLLGPGFASADAPAVTAVSPNSGSGDGGDTVTLKGSGFYCGTGGPVVQGSMNPYNGRAEPPPHDYLNVFFGQAAANILSTPSDGEMTVQTPAGEGTVDVTVSCVAGNTVSSQPNKGDRYTYISTLAPAGSGHGGSTNTSFSADSSSAPSDLAQTGGGPLARALSAATPPWAALALLLLPAGWLARRRFGRR